MKLHLKKFWRRHIHQQSSYKNMEQKEKATREVWPFSMRTRRRKSLIHRQWMSHHIYGNTRIFLSLKKKGGDIILENNASTKMLGKGRVDIYVKNIVVNVLLVEGLNQNIMSVVQMNNRGHVVVFYGLWLSLMSTQETTRRILTFKEKNDRENQASWAHDHHNWIILVMSIPTIYFSSWDFSQLRETPN